MYKIIWKSDCKQFKVESDGDRWWLRYGDKNIAEKIFVKPGDDVYQWVSKKVEEQLKKTDVSIAKLERQIEDYQHEKQIWRMLRCQI